MSRDKFISLAELALILKVRTVRVGSYGIFVDEGEWNEANMSAMILMVKDKFISAKELAQILHVKNVRIGSYGIFVDEEEWNEANMPAMSPQS
jgi:hypothetical protein